MDAGAGENTGSLSKTAPQTATLEILVCSVLQEDGSEVSPGQEQGPRR